MYIPSVGQNSMLPLSRIFGLNIDSNKGLDVFQEEEWQDLLVNVSTRGCRQSFRKIFDRFFSMILHQNLKSGLSKEIAAELAQETMLKVWRQASYFDPAKGTPSVWIYTIARNTRYDYFRSRRNDPLSLFSEDLYSFDNVLALKSEDWDSLLDVSILRSKIVELPLEQKEVIESIYLNGLTHEEISKAMNIPLGTVKSRARLALAAIKLKFEGGEK